MFKRFRSWILKEIETPAQKRDLLLFFLAATLNLAWCAWMTVEAFGLNAPDHSISFSITFWWLTSMTGYIGHKSHTRWHGASLDGSRSGHWMGVLTQFFGIVIVSLYLLRSDVRIPEQLMWGLTGSLGILTGWQLIKSYHHRCQQNGNDTKPPPC